MPAPSLRRPAALLCLALLPVLVWYGNPAVALLAGGGVALGLDQRPFDDGSRWARLSLQSAIVLLGLKLDLQTVWSLSAEYTVLVAGYVLLTLAAGAALGRLLLVETPSARLIGAGTAICGGTAIATLSAVVRAQPQQTAVALAIVFLLNIVALMSFPWIGRALDLTQVQFGLWSALAIHDTSSVIATAAIYGEEAAEVATTIKLGRTLWLIPLTFALSLIVSRAADAEAAAVPRLRVPGFVLAFLAAAALGTVWRMPAVVPEVAGTLSRWLLVVALLLVGTELTRSTVRHIRGRALLLALLLWALAAPATLAAVMWMV
jgi:uncharacterized integral membrane protein (TIGR00698 family)